MASVTKNGRSGFKPQNNAEGIRENHLFGINRLVKLSVVIEGKIVSHYRHFSLTQKAGGHHRFEMILAHDALGNRENHNLESSNSFLGKRITVVIKYKDIQNSPERSFVGVITEVGYLQEQGSLGNIVLTGYSPTILLDGAPHTQSFGGSEPTTIGTIADKVIKEGLGSSRFDVRVDANDYSEIPFSAQYNETHYNYLARMAEAYGEQFYYDGEVLHFGKLPAQNQPIKLVYGSNVSDVKIALKAVHTKPQFYGYNSSQHSRLTSGDTPVKHKGELAKTAYSHNDTIYKTPALQVAPIKAQTDQDVVHSQESASGSAGVEVFTVTGNTTVPFLHPGCVADLQMRKQDTNETAYFTKVMITEVEYDIDTKGHYTGKFKAIASDTGFMPKPEFQTPTAQPQIATVTSNADPEGQGRVQVQFDWQLNDTTNYIRMMSPDAGGTDQVTQNRGYVAIPEVGDQVMVGFVHNHPDRPFVMGGMFHGQVGLGGGSDNRVKSIMTRSGHKVIFTEDESIIITDKSGNEIHLDTTGSNINITAPETINIKCNNLNIDVAQNMNTTVGENQNNSVGMNISESAGMNKSESAGANHSITAGGMMVQNAIMDYTLMAANIMEVAQGERKSRAKEMKENAKNKEVSIQENNDWHTQKEFNNNTGEKSKSQ